MFRAILGVGGLAVALIAPLVYAGPQLASDLRVGGQWALADDLAIKQFKCTRWYLLVSTCSVDYVRRRERERVGGTLNYLVFGSWSGERARLLRSTSDPKHIGTTLGLEHMQQRLASFGIFVALALASLCAIFRLAVRSLASDEASANERTVNGLSRLAGKHTA